MTNSPKWYIVKNQDSRCQIVSTENEDTIDTANSWGPFTTKDEAIARRVGLIRAGKCQPF